MGHRRGEDTDVARHAVRTPMECSADVQSVAPLALIGCSIATTPRQLLRARPSTSHQRGRSAGRAAWRGKDDRLASDSFPAQHTHRAETKSKTGFSPHAVQSLRNQLCFSLLAPLYFIINLFN